MTNAIWGLAQENLRKAIGTDNFRTWIEPLRFLGVEERVARFDAPTRFVGTWVARNYADHIRAQLTSTGTAIDRVEFATAAGEAPRNGRATPAIHGLRESAASDGVHCAPDTPAPRRGPPAGRGNGNANGPDNGGAVLGASLDPRFSFESFVVGKPNELAHAAARRVAEGETVTFNPLYVYGGVGLGKTHLLHAIAWELGARAPHRRVLYLSAEQFMYRFIQALRDKTVMDFKAQFRSVDVLLVDDVQFIAGKDSTQEEFFHTFNALVDQNRQIVLSSDKPPSEIVNLEERIRSRLQCGLVVDLHPADYELRLGILQQKATYYARQYGGVDLGDGILEYLAHRITASVRELEGALTRLFAFASLVGKPVTMELVQECLTDVLRACERRATVEDIQRKVADHYNIRLSDLIGPRRPRSIARPRQVAMYLAKQLTTRSLPEIGRRFGGRDHTTIIHGVRRIEELMQSDRQLAEDLALLRRLLDG